MVYYIDNEQDEEKKIAILGFYNPPQKIPFRAAKSDNL